MVPWKIFNSNNFVQFYWLGGKLDLAVSFSSLKLGNFFGYSALKSEWGTDATRIKVFQGSNHILGRTVCEPFWSKYSIFSIRFRCAYISTRERKKNFKSNKPFVCIHTFPFLARKYIFAVNLLFTFLSKVYRKLCNAWI